MKTVAAAEKSAKGFLMSLDDRDMRDALCARPLAQDQNDPGADAAAAALAASVSHAATDHAGRAPSDAGAPGLDETAGRVLRAAWAGKITPEEAVSLLMELGLPEATIRALMADRDERAGEGGRKDVAWRSAALMSPSIQWRLIVRKVRQPARLPADTSATIGHPVGCMGQRRGCSRRGAENERSDSH